MEKTIVKKNILRLLLMWIILLCLTYIPLAGISAITFGLCLVLSNTFNYVGIFISIILVIIALILSLFFLDFIPLVKAKFYDDWFIKGEKVGGIKVIKSAFSQYKKHFIYVILYNTLYCFIRLLVGLATFGGAILIAVSLNVLELLTILLPIVSILNCFVVYFVDLKEVYRNYGFIKNCDGGMVSSINRKEINKSTLKLTAMSLIPVVGFILYLYFNTVYSIKECLNVEEILKYEPTTITADVGKIRVWKTMKATIEGYGFKYSFLDFAKTTSIFLIVVIAVGKFMEMKWMYIFILCLAVSAMMPSLIKSQFKFIYEQNRFNDLSTYMQQMAYSFKKKPKILSALEDTAEVSTGKMNSLINVAIGKITNDYSSTVYQDALYLIQQEYECNRIIQLHDFLCKIEEKGGEYSTSMDILIDDIAGWTQRTYTFQKERAQVKNHILLSLIIALIICAVTLFMVPKNINITDNIIYQVMTTIILALFVGIYVMSQIKLNGSWLKNDVTKDEERIRRDYKTIHSAITKEKTRNSYIAAACMIPFAIFGIILKYMNSNIWWIVLAVAILAMIYFIQSPKLNLRNATRNTIREIEKELPGWCREIALNLQTENVYNSILLTLDSCPVVLEIPLQDLIIEINENPGSVVPYNKFLSEFNIPEVGRMMKILYSLSELGTEDADEQINKIIEQNNKLLEKAEILANEDSIGRIQIFTLVPMLLGSLKMMVDMVLLFLGFMAAT